MASDCPDVNGDADLNVDELAEHINCSFVDQSCRVADYNATGGVNAGDLACSLNALVAGAEKLPLVGAPLGGGLG